MSGRIFLANVGANASHRFAGPVFEDGSFEFLPIPEQPDLQGTHAVRYGDLVSFNTPGCGLREYVPERLWDRAAHADPEFESFTYGDNCEWSPRAAGLRSIERGDVLLFLARLERWDRGTRTRTFGFYLVGFLEIDTVLRNVCARPSESEMARFGGNAHVRRGLSDSSCCPVGSSSRRGFATTVRWRRAHQARWRRSVVWARPARGGLGGPDLLARPSADVGGGPRGGPPSHARIASASRGAWSALHFFKGERVSVCCQAWRWPDRGTPSRRPRGLQERAAERSPGVQVIGSCLCHSELPVHLPCDRPVPAGPLSTPERADTLSDSSLSYWDPLRHRVAAGV